MAVPGCTGCSSCSKGAAPSGAAQADGEVVDATSAVAALQVTEAGGEMADPVRVAAEAAALKSYHADLCWFGAASLRNRDAAGFAPVSPRGGGAWQRAAHACNLAASQREPAVRDLDDALAALAPAVGEAAASAGKKHFEVSRALEVAMTRLGAAVAFRAGTRTRAIRRDRIGTSRAKGL